MIGTLVLLSLTLGRKEVYRFTIRVNGGTLIGSISVDARTGAADLKASAGPHKPLKRIVSPGKILDPCDTYAPPWGRPSAGFFFLRSSPTLWVLSSASDPENNWEYTNVTLYRRIGSRWAALKFDQPLEFSHRGGCEFTRNGVLLWDFIVDKGHMGPSRYRLCLFDVKEGDLVKKWDRITHRYYLPHEGDTIWPPPNSVPSEDDPLREFGYKWNWWANPVAIHDHMG